MFGPRRGESKQRDPPRSRDSSLWGIASVPVRSWYGTSSPGCDFVAVEIPRAKGWSAVLASFLHKCTGQSSEHSQPKKEKRMGLLGPPCLTGGLFVFPGRLYELELHLHSGF